MPAPEEEEEVDEKLQECVAQIKSNSKSLEFISYEGDPILRLEEDSEKKTKKSAKKKSAKKNPSPSKE